MINCLLFADDLVLPVSSQQSSACEISTEITKVLCLSTNPRQCMLQASGNTLQQVETFKYLGVIFASDGRWSEQSEAGIVKLKQFCVSFSLCVQKTRASKHCKAVSF